MRRQTSVARPAAPASSRANVEGSGTWLTFAAPVAATGTSRIVTDPPATMTRVSWNQGVLDDRVGGEAGRGVVGQGQIAAGERDDCPIRAAERLGIANLEHTRLEPERGASADASIGGLDEERAGAGLGQHAGLGQVSGLGQIEGPAGLDLQVSAVERQVAGRVAEDVVQGRNNPNSDFWYTGCGEEMQSMGFFVAAMCVYCSASLAKCRPLHEPIDAERRLVLIALCAMAVPRGGA